MPRQKHKFKETVAQVRAAHLQLAVLTLRSYGVITDKGTGKTLNSGLHFNVMEKDGSVFIKPGSLFGSSDGGPGLAYS